jgi:3-hydroxyacyl-CoA dehydrogenase
VAIVGTGLIGASWAACFLANGLDVVATDPAPGAEDQLRNYVETAWPTLIKLGLRHGASTTRLSFKRSLPEAVSDVDFVQESGPERESFKVQLFAEMDALLPERVLLASSSSGIRMTAIQSRCKSPHRCVIGHPFSPPHLIPLVEVVGGEKTSAETIDRAMRFYCAMGKRPIHIRKEIIGHVGNRLQAALFREVVHLIDQDVISVADIDAVVCNGPGLRWSLMGPVLAWHLGGGKGGMEQFLQQFTGPITTWWNDLGTADLSQPALRKKLIEGAIDEAGERSYDAMTNQRDARLIALLQLLQESHIVERSQKSGRE